MSSNTFSNGLARRAIGRLDGGFAHYHSSSNSHNTHALSLPPSQESFASRPRALPPSAHCDGARATNFSLDKKAIDKRVWYSKVVWIRL